MILVASEFDRKAISELNYTHEVTCEFDAMAVEYR